MSMRKIFFVLLIVIVSGCTIPEYDDSFELKDSYSIATFASGCFWGIESAFESKNGVVEAVPGYTGGSVENPTYEQVSTGTTGHKESVRVYYTPNIINYEELLSIYWNHINPVDSGGQSLNRGSQYTTAIFYHDSAQKELAEESKSEVQEDYDMLIVTEILPAGEFYKAEEYHQDYYTK